MLLLPGHRTDRRRGGSPRAIPSVDAAVLAPAGRRARVALAVVSLAALLVAALMVRSGWSLLREASTVLLEGSPSGVRTEDDLPQNARDYLQFISDFVGVPIALIGVGPGRDQVIWTDAGRDTYAARAGGVTV